MPPAETSRLQPRGPWQRLHAALMPDYNPRATAYWWAVVVLGAALLVWAVVHVTTLALASPWLGLQVGLGIAVAMLAGLVPVRIPHSRNSFAAGEIFIFLLLLKFGPAAAALAAAGEAFIGSWRTSRRWTSRLFSPAMAAVAMVAAGSALHAALAWLPPDPGLLIVGAMMASLAYFCIITLLVTSVPRLKAGEPLRLSDLLATFGWVGIAYAASAAVAALLHLVSRESGEVVLWALVPLLVAILVALHFAFRQQEQSERVRRAQEEATERERELAQRHMQELESSERRFNAAFTHAAIGMALLGVDGRLRLANDALRELLALDDQALVDRPFQAQLWPEDVAAFDAALQDVHRPGFDGFALELRCRHRDGHAVWVDAHCAFFSEPGAQESSLILQVQDITARRMAEAELQHIAFHDPLTGLPNRRRFHDLLDAAVQRAAADAGAAFAVMFLDFDRFKLINDSLGHNAGDAFLVQVAQRLADRLRPGDVVARLGGDEFAVLLQPLEHDSHAVTLADRLMEALRQPFQVAGTEINTSASIGITFSSFGYARGEDVLRDADIAMYKAKGAGKARYALFDASLHTEVADRLRLEGELRRAVEAGQLTVAFQPIFALADGRIDGFEALVRWQHPLHGLVSPGAFLSVAEESGLMPRLTDFVLHFACRTVRQWQSLHPTLARVKVSVNLSSNDVAHPALVARVTRALVESGLHPRHLVLELTEDILASRLEGALPVLTELRQLGVELAVDDFGTGYSSLAHLARLPIGTLKIDRSFVSGLQDMAEQAAVVRAVVMLGASLGKQVVAEGIEQEAQRETLRSLGCGYGQGHHLGRPLPADATEALLRDRLELLPARLPTAASRDFAATQSGLLH